MTDVDKFVVGPPDHPMTTQATLADAFMAAKPGDVIYVIDDVSGNEGDAVDIEIAENPE